MDNEVKKYKIYLRGGQVLTIRAKEVKVNYDEDKIDIIENYDPSMTLEYIKLRDVSAITSEE